MKMKVFLVLALLLVHGCYNTCVASTNRMAGRQVIQNQSSSIGNEQDVFNQTLQLMAKLALTETMEGNTRVFTGPSSEKIQSISDKIIALASESAYSRTEVIRALAQVVDDRVIQRELIIASRWFARDTIDQAI